MKTAKPILDALHGKQATHVPLWLMRQAGRYLPEYRELRTKAGNFLDLCLTPEWAAEITLQPSKRFNLDAAILFADILLVPYALGQKLEFREGEGPRLEALRDEKDLARLEYDDAKLTPVMETLGLVKSRLPAQTALIGFCGGPWTVAAYMIEGKGKNGFSKALQWAQEKPEWMERLVAVLIEASEKYLLSQIAAGAEIIQVFESWAGLLDGDLFARWVTGPTRELVARVKKAHPGIPVIGFPREAGGNYENYARQTGVDVVGIDQHVDLGYAKEKLQPLKILQGNLDPGLLAKGGEDMRAAAEKILAMLGPRHIFNLGHGVLPQTPPAHVAELARLVHAYKA
ncbi:MAG TPA: uroporphyrinogen decarboxylase [Alphaproteobacteria bacterium]|nr:uroporphyrinogen decarboxylase [Alphaproteobacteria bacterium]